MFQKGIFIVSLCHSHIWACAIVPSFFLNVFIFLWPICFSSWVTVSYLDSPLLHNSPSIDSQLLWFCHTMKIHFHWDHWQRSISVHRSCHLCSPLQSGANVVKEMESITLHMPRCSCGSTQSGIGTIWRCIWWVTGSPRCHLLPKHHALY